MVRLGEENEKMKKKMGWNGRVEWGWNIYGRPPCALFE